MPAFEKARYRGLIVLGLVVATLGVGALALPSLDAMSNRGVEIIEFELAGTADRAADFYDDLGSTGRAAARDSIYFDFPFLVMYALAFAAACLVVAARARERALPRLADWGRRLAIGAILAASCDVVENLALLTVLDGRTGQPWPGIAFGFASVKFLLLIAALLYVVGGFVATLRRPRPA